VNTGVWAKGEASVSNHYSSSLLPGRKLIVLTIKIFESARSVPFLALFLGDLDITMCFRRYLGKAMLILLLSLMVLQLQSVCSVQGSGNASVSIQEADSAVREAFQAVLKDERAGANVSGLLATLNEAGSLLAQAEMAYRNGDSGGAANYANNAYATAESVMTEASSLLSFSQAEASNTLLYSLVFSVSGALVFLAGLFLGWSRFKNRHAKKQYDLKPEVRPNVEA
jgi:hypothetical protein